MGLFDGLLGGVVGGEMAVLVNGLIEKHGGIQGIVDQFAKQGLGATVQSWISSGPNQPVTADQLHQALSPDVLRELAAKSGLSTQDLAAKLSSILPQVIDKLTPEGKVPQP
ncbi:MAG TPA: YidB family protein [Burkholderiaceae bacterium]